jgi:hypothetical protein
MIHPLLEFLPLLAGCTYGFVASRIELKSLWPNLLIGALCTWVAGELTQGLALASMALLVDSASAVAGRMLIHYILQLATGTAAISTKKSKRPTKPRRHAAARRQACEGLA